MIPIATYRKTTHKLIKIANELDRNGLYKEADEVDAIIKSAELAGPNDAIDSLHTVKRDLEDLRMASMKAGMSFVAGEPGAKQEAEKEANGVEERIFGRLDEVIDFIVRHRERIYR